MKKMIERYSNFKIKKICGILAISIIVLNIYNPNKVFAKYIFEREMIIAEIINKKEDVKIELKNIESDNKYNKNMANKNNKINIKYEIDLENIETYYFNDKAFSIFIGENKLNHKYIKTNVKKIANNKINYNISISGVKENGKIKIYLEDGFFIYNKERKNKQFLYNTNLLVDNNPPVISTIKEIGENSEMKVTIKSNEKIYEIKGWNKVNEKEYYKESIIKGKNNIDIVDYGGNLTTVEINV